MTVVARCALAKDVRDICRTEFVKDVFSMGRLCDRFLCGELPLCRTKGGHDISAHKHTFVTGHCIKCANARIFFFACPKHQNGKESQSLPLGSEEISTDGSSQVGTCRRR